MLQRPIEITSATGATMPLSHCDTWIVDRQCAYSVQRVPDCLGGLSRVGISSRSTRPWNGQPPSYILRKLYYTMVQPYLTYGIILWGSTYQSYLKRTVILQKKAIRYIHKADYNAHTKPLFYASKVLNIHYTGLYIFTGSSQIYA